MLLLGIIILFAYVVGSINAGLILSYLQGLDIRTKGSGNAGATNVLRVIGIKSGITVFIIDCLKGVFAIYGTAILLSNSDQSLIFSKGIYFYIASLASVVGHSYPVWFSFRGGKGAATGLGNILYIHPGLTIGPLLVFIAILVLSRYVGLSTILAFFSLSMFAYFYMGIEDIEFLTYLFLLFLFILYAHRDNIKSMLKKSEHKISF
jgi:glycerol-3-phosphate acyltransferase PlsY